MLTNKKQPRNALVVSNNGDMLAYDLVTKQKNEDKEFKQIYVLEIDWNKILNAI